ncbi:anhydro-N-acetylmuramic acid kinase [Chelativorans sp. M5D2P16]|uniref:anhydro-N-acetylmuramic acid kinase n=1 Tax=Chelativorans sp. M5D2P16 TaxID=3095678 RepID=UPI002ACA548F|nr:anhydro-N-acetylmuramic acid kinase [Chelativorans sp. M5D2P16]MDZ5697041.1 anhydro-N-acetylmuramic acid kinase [Chelativorans sp. M5D2P16]
MAETIALGLMSGTSMDGIDLAVLVTDGENLVRRGPSMAVGYEAAFRRRIETALTTARQIDRREERPGELLTLEREITERHAAAVERFIAGPASGWKPEIVGFHGQTVLHRPERALTVQLGDGALLARRTGLAVVYDMRAEDMRHGGQGAPLIPAYHAALAASLPPPHAGRFPVAFVNVGGIANVTYVPRAGPPVAFDTGPGNALIDQWVTREGGIPFDAEGMIASEGAVVSSVVGRYLDNPFFSRAAPKSLDRGDFTLDHATELELADGARTLARVSAESIARAVDHLPAKPELWVVSGGGRKNPHILADLQAIVAPATVLRAEEAGLDGDAMEAEAWAYLAVRAVKGLPLTFPTTTGCRKAVSGGVLASP